MHVLSVQYLAIFVTFLRVTLITVGKSSLNLLIPWLIFFLGGEIHKINLGLTCFNSVGLKSETNNIFFRPGPRSHTFS